jgi:hypothetical protein
VLLVSTCNQIPNFTGDITERDVDVIVNTANSYLKHGGPGCVCIDSSIDIIEFYIFDNEALDCFKTEFVNVNDIK